MADDPTTTTNVMEDSVVKSIENVRNLDNQMHEFSKTAGQTSEAVLRASQIIGGKSASVAQSALYKTSSAEAGIKRHIGSIKKHVKSLNVNNIIKDTVKDQGSMFGSIAKGLKTTYKTMGKDSNELNQILSSGAAITWTRIQATVLDKADKMSGGLLSMQKDVMDVQKSALEMGVGFGKSFDQAQDGTNMYLNTFATMRGALNASKEDLGKIQAKFKDTMDTTAQIQGFKNLQTVNEQLGKGMNATSSAFLVAKATGTDAGKVADWMGQMYTKLGEDLEGAATSLGDIQDATKDSGLSFDKVGEAIIGSADQLKMWGGTVKAVAPMFKAFSRTLEQGQKGLAPELLQKYTAGLQQMGFASRALIGMQLPGMEGKGALGAGLEMEAALEGGEEGTKKITQGLIDTIKKFGGGDVVTRKQAIENPALERSFMVQRGILKNMLKVDEATATKMMASLQDIDKNGIVGASDAEKSFSDLLQAGKDTQQATTDAITAAGNKAAEASLKGADIITASLGSILAKMGGRRAMAQYRKMLNATIGKGQLKMEDLVKALNGQDPSRKTRSDTVRKRPVATRKFDRETAEGLKSFRRRGEGATSIMNIAKGMGANKIQQKDLSKKMSQAFRQERAKGESIEDAFKAAKKAGIDFVKAMHGATKAAKEHSKVKTTERPLKDLISTRKHVINRPGVMDQPNVPDIVQKKADDIKVQPAIGDKADALSYQKGMSEINKSITSRFEGSKSKPGSAIDTVKKLTKATETVKPNIDFSYIEENKKRREEFFRKMSKQTGAPENKIKEAYEQRGDLKTTHEYENRTFDFAASSNKLINEGVDKSTQSKKAAIEKASLDAEVIVNVKKEGDTIKVDVDEEQVEKAVKKAFNLGFGTALRKILQQ